MCPKWAQAEISHFALSDKRRQVLIPNAAIQCPLTVYFRYQQLMGEQSPMPEIAEVARNRRDISKR